MSEGRGRGALRLPGPRVSQTVFPRGPRRAGEGMGLHLLRLCLPPPKLAEHWELSRCDPGRGAVSSPRPAMLCPEPGAAHRRQQRPRPPGSPCPRPSAPAPLPAQRCPGNRPGRPQRRPPGAAPAGTAPVPARGGGFPRPGEKTRRREREGGGSRSGGARMGADGPGWRGRTHRCRWRLHRGPGREREEPRARALMGHGDGPGRGV